MFFAWLPESKLGLSANRHIRARAVMACVSCCGFLPGWTLPLLEPCQSSLYGEPRPELVFDLPVCGKGDAGFDSPMNFLGCGRARIFWVCLRIGFSWSVCNLFGRVAVVKHEQEAEQSKNGNTCRDPKDRGWFSFRLRAIGSSAGYRSFPLLSFTLRWLRFVFFGWAWPIDPPATFAP